MTKEEKIKYKKQRAYIRKGKRILKDKSYLRTSALYDRGYSLSWGRKKQHGSIFICSMEWKSCEDRGYCNGDC